VKTNTIDSSPHLVTTVYTTNSVNINRLSIGNSFTDVAQRISLQAQRPTSSIFDGSIGLELFAVYGGCPAGQGGFPQTASASVACSGLCNCDPARMMRSPTHGNIFDGDGLYRPNDACIWKIVSDTRPAIVVFNIKQTSGVDTQRNVDSVWFYECTDLSCQSKNLFAELAGYWDGDWAYHYTWMSHTGITSIEFYSDASVQELGFEFDWKLEMPRSPCDRCDFGTYKGAIGDFRCTACPAHSTTIARSSLAVSDCECAPGAYGPNNGPICALCETGKYRGNDKQSVCTDCPANTYLDLDGQVVESACRHCHFDSASTAGSKTASACMCNPGHELDLTSPIASCLMCNENTFKPGTKVER